MAFKLKHKGAATLMQSLSAMPKPVRKMPVQKAPVKKDPDSKRAKSSAELRRDAEGRVVGTSTEKGGDIPLGTKQSTRKIAAREGKLFDDKGNVIYGKNKKFEDNLLTYNDGTIYGYVNTKGKRVKFEDKDKVNVRNLKDGSRVGGRLTGTGIQNRALANAAGEYYQYNSKIDRVNRASDRAGKVVAAERAGENVRYKKEDQNVKTAGAKKVKGMGPVKKYKK